MLLRLKIYGDVQGVGFRYSAREKAKELGLAGFARNEPDGSVYAEVEGPREKLEEFLAWCEKDAPGAVRKVWREFSNETGRRSDFGIE